MNDKEWDDYIRRQTGTFWGEFAKQHDETVFSSTSLPVSGPISGSVHEDGAELGGTNRGGSVVDGFLGMADWVIERVPPLRNLNTIARAVTQVRWRPRTMMAGIGAILFGMWIAGPAADAAVWPWGHAALHGFAGSYALYLAVAFGGSIGWVAPDLAGLGVAFLVMLLGFAIGLAAVATVLALMYLVVAAIAGWAPFEPVLPGTSAAQTSEPRARADAPRVFRP